jgi:hypothetical protein
MISIKYFSINNSTYYINNEELRIEEMNIKEFNLIKIKMKTA